MAVKMSQAECDAAIARIHEHRDNAVSHLRGISDNQDGMRPNWQGNSSSKYMNTSAQQNDDFEGLIQHLDHIVHLGTTHIRSLAAGDGNS